MTDKFFIDTEFLEGTQTKRFLWFKEKTVPTIDLISIAIAKDNGRHYYAVCNEFNLQEAWNRYDLVINKHYPMCPEYNKVYWIRDNVLKTIFREWYGVANNVDPTVFDHKFTYKEFARLLKKEGKPRTQIALGILNFVHGYRDMGNWLGSTEEYYNSLSSQAPKNRVAFYGYYSDYDWVVFCWIFGRMIALPKGFPQYCIDLQQTFEEMVSREKITVRSTSDGFSQREYFVGDHYGTKFSDMVEHFKNNKNYPKPLENHSAKDDAIWTRNFHDFLYFVKKS